MKRKRLTGYKAAGRPPSRPPPPGLLPKVLGVGLGTRVPSFPTLSGARSASLGGGGVGRAASPRLAHQALQPGEKLFHVCVANEKRELHSLQMYANYCQAAF